MTMLSGSLCYRQLAFLITFTLVTFGTSASQQPENRAGQSRLISRRIHAEDCKVKAGSPIWIDVTEKNKSHGILTVGRERPLDMDQGGESIFVDIWDSHGVRSPESAFYRKRLGHLTPTERAARGTQPLTMSSGFLVLLKPGDETTNRIDIGRLYDLTRPGKYTIQLAHSASNKISVRIIP